MLQVSGKGLSLRKIFFLIATSVYTGNCDQLCLALQVRAQCLRTSVLSPAQEDVPTR